MARVGMFLALVCVFLFGMTIPGALAARSRCRAVPRSVEFTVPSDWELSDSKPVISAEAQAAINGNERAKSLVSASTEREVKITRGKRNPNVCTWHYDYIFIWGGCWVLNPVPVAHCDTNYCQWSPPWWPGRCWRSDWNIYQVVLWCGPCGGIQFRCLYTPLKCDCCS